MNGISYQSLPGTYSYQLVNIPYQKQAVEVTNNSCNKVQGTQNEYSDLKLKLENVEENNTLSVYYVRGGNPKSLKASKNLDVYPTRFNEI